MSSIEDNLEPGEEILHTLRTSPAVFLSPFFFFTVSIIILIISLELAAKYNEYQATLGAVLFCLSGLIFVFSILGAISAAVMRDAAHARTHLFQDAEGWKRRGLVDVVYPMDYEPDAARFQGWARQWVKACGRESVVVGIGVHLLADPAAVTEQVRLLRTAPAAVRPAGWSFFAYSEIFRTPVEPAPDAATLARKASLRKLVLALNRPELISAGK